MSSHHQPKPYRRHLGGDLFVTVDPAHPEHLLVDSGFRLSGWKPRPPQLANRPAFPGTAVLWQDRWLELIKIESSEGRVLYRLQPWDSAQVMRAPQELTAEYGARATETHRQQVRNAQKGNLAGWMIFFVGLLPADEQKRLELTYGIRPTVGTGLSAAVLTSGSVFSLFLAFAYKRGLPLGGLTSYAQVCTIIWPIFLFLIIEGLLRISSALSGEPSGSVLVAGPFSLLQWLSGRRSPAKSGYALPPAASAPRGREAQWLNEQDKVGEPKEDAEGRARLQIESRLPKDHWRAQADAIDWQGRRYILDQRQTQEARAHQGYGYRFLLLEAAPDALFRNIHPYHPSEVIEVYKAKKRLLVGSWVNTFGMLWGFTDPRLQESLADLYGYDAWRNTQRSIIASAVSGAFFALTAVSRLAAAEGSLADLMIMGFGAFLLWEAARRFSRLSAGELSASRLGPALAPFAKRTLRWRAAPEWHYPDR